MRDLERRSLTADVLENPGAAVRDRRYSAIFSHLLRQWRGSYFRRYERNFASPTRGGFRGWLRPRE
jgi:hypothetical protein